MNENSQKAQQAKVPVNKARTVGKLWQNVSTP